MRVVQDWNCLNKKTRKQENKKTRKQEKKKRRERDEQTRNLLTVCEGIVQCCGDVGPRF